MVLDIAPNQRTLFCDVHRENGGFYVGYSPDERQGSLGQVKSELCPLKPLPVDSRWMLSEGTQDGDITELWAIVDADETQSKGVDPARWRGVLPQLSFVCVIQASARHFVAQLRWVFPPHELQGRWSGTMEGPESDGARSIEWFASQLEAEALFVSEENSRAVLALMTEHPTHTTDSSKPTFLRFEFMSGSHSETSTPTIVVVDVSGWEHALLPLQKECGLIGQG